jgi:Fe-S cluster assembly scaffold protein SufB
MRKKNPREEQDLKGFIQKTKGSPYVEDLSKIESLHKERMLSVGVDLEEKERSGTFIQFDHSLIYTKSLYEGIEIMDITEALKRYNWLATYSFKIIPKDLDTFTQRVYKSGHGGYFIRAKPKVKSIFPLQACLFLSKEKILQDVHNIIIAEEDSELSIITGCATASYVKKGMHIGISEFYVKRNAKVSFTMIHNWAEEVIVRPRTVAIVEEGGVFLSNYICLKPVKNLQMYLKAELIGKNSTAYLNSILYAHKGALLDVGSRVILSAPLARAEIITRAITGGGEIFARGSLVGEVSDVKAHLECRGLILSEEGRIYAIPELEGKIKDIDLSHEAAVGKIAKEEIEYLQSRGLTFSEAQAAIVRGFLNVEILGLPSQLKKEIDKAIELCEKEVL